MLVSKETSKVCSKTHSVLPTNNYNAFQNFGQRSKKGKKESFKYWQDQPVKWKHNFFVRVDLRGSGLETLQCMGAI